MSEPELFNEPIPHSVIERLARDSFEDMVKFVVDLRRKTIAAGGGLHSDEEKLLLESGSVQEDLWGANYYLNDKSENRFEYTSMINIRPSQDNRAQDIQSEEIRKQVRDLAIYFFEKTS